MFDGIQTLQACPRPRWCRRGSSRRRGTPTSSPGTPPPSRTSSSTKCSTADSRWATAFSFFYSGCVSVVLKFSTSSQALKLLSLHFQLSIQGSSVDTRATILANTRATIVAKNGNGFTFCTWFFMFHTVQDFNVCSNFLFLVVSYLSSFLWHKSPFGHPALLVNLPPRI